MAKGHVLLLVAYTERDDRIRIISAREVTQIEQDDYFRQDAEGPADEGRCYRARCARGLRCATFYRIRPCAYEADAAGENHPPGSGLDAGGIRSPLSHPARDTARLGARTGGTGSTHAGIPDTDWARPGARQSYTEFKAELNRTEPCGARALRGQGATLPPNAR